MRVGYHLSCEEHAASRLVELAQLAEKAGFDFACISDHFHPWTSGQGHSPFVWSVLGGIAEATRRLEVGTGVSCPIMRVHPAIVAHAAATVATMMPGRFFLGLGSGERLNEHVLGGAWPPPVVRLAMLEEAVAVIRALWSGRFVTYRGRFFTVEDARIFDLTEQTVPIFLAASGPRATDLAGRVADGLIAAEPSADLVRRFHHSGGVGKAVLGMTHVCVAPSTEEALSTVRRFWPNVDVPGGLELPHPRHFEAFATMVSDDALARGVVLGKDPDEHVRHLQAFAATGFGGVWVHQVGPDQADFLRFYGREVIPRLRSLD